MLPVFICLTFLATLLLGCFFYFRLRRSIDSFSTEVSLMVQYKTFIDLVLSENSGARLLPAKGNTALIQTKDAQGVSTLSLSKVQGKIIVVWSWTSPGFGKRGKEWSFSYHHNQAHMYLEIKKKIDDYQTSLYQQHNRTVPANKE